MAIATDGEAIVMHPLPADFQSTRIIHVAPEMPPITPDSGDATTDTYDLSALENPPVYRIAINAQKLAHLAEAMQNEVVVLELPSEPDGKPIKVLPYSGAKSGFLMPLPTPPGMTEGLLVEAPTAAREKRAEKTPAELPPPVVTASAERHTLEIAFGGVPAKEIREALKDPALAFRYSGRGTRRGVPANTWYGPDNPFTREKVQSLLGVQIAPAKAA
jgi:hypothetical protein